MMLEYAFGKMSVRCACSRLGKGMSLQRVTLDVSSLAPAGHGGGRSETGVHQRSLQIGRVTAKSLGHLSIAVVRVRNTFLGGLK